MKKIKLLTLAGVLGLSLVSSISTIAATTLYSTTLTGKSSQSSYVYLGSGTRYLYASRKNQTASAQAKKIVSYMPDPTVADVGVRNGEWSEKGFTANSTNDNGTTQSYYIKWSSWSAESRG